MVVDTQLDRLTIPQMLERSRRLYSSNIAMRYAVSDSFRAITYDDFYRLVMQAAECLRRAGIKPGDKVGILAENRPEWGATYFATLFLGAINVPLDSLLKQQELSYIILHSGIKALVASAKLIPEIESLRDSIETFQTIISMDKDYGDFPYLLGNADFPLIPAPAVSIDDLAVIIYTSGTTGLAKGVMLSHGNIISDIWGSLQCIDMHQNDIFISILPLHHTFECTCGFLTPLSGGASITYARGLAPRLIIEDIRNNKATIMLGVPLLYEKIFGGLTKEISKKPPFTRAKFKTAYGISKFFMKVFNLEAGKALFGGLREKAGLSSIRLMIAGGAPMMPEIAEAFNILGFRLIQGYGLTESSPVLTLNPLNEYKNDSIGKPLPNARLKINKPNESGIGEIIANGPMVMKGYFKNPQATAEVIRDGWLYTGDLGRVDGEGYYYIAGRSKNVIVTPGGKNVYPEEIEFNLNKSPYILESLVLGRPVDGGEEIEAIIVPDLEYFSARAQEKGIELSELNIEKTIKLEVAKLSEELAEYKRVKYIIIREEAFEKTSTRKIKRYLYYNKPVKLQSAKNRGNS